jgi:16S rRNA C967 or C1407 C5-methylase (RsmB/RsmF family)
MLTHDLLSDPTLSGSVFAHDGDSDRIENLKARLDRLELENGVSSHWRKSGCFVDDEERKGRVVPFGLKAQ